MSESAATERRRVTDPILQEILEEQRATRAEVAKTREEFAEVRVELQKREMYQRLADGEIENLKDEIHGTENDPGLKKRVESHDHKITLVTGGAIVLGAIGSGIMWLLERAFK